MSIEIESKKRKLRLISGVPEVVDVQVNELLDEYAASSWTFQVVGDHVVVTAIMVLLSELRKMQIANIQPVNSRGH